MPRPHRLPGRLRPVLSTLALLALCGAAAAQPAPTRLRGVITKTGGTELVVSPRAGSDISVRLPDGVRLASVARASLSDIKPGSFIGTAAMPAGEGRLRALEVVVFPEAMRGTGEGHRPWDLMPESTMTNATVASTVGAVDGENLKLTYQGGQQNVVVSPETPIVTLAPATRADLKPGARVVVTVSKDAEGHMTAASVVVGRDGVDPPM